MAKSSCTYRKVLRGFVKAREAMMYGGGSWGCLDAHNIKDETPGCTLTQIRRHLSRAERAGLVSTRVMKTRAKARRGRVVTRRTKCYMRVPRRKRK